MDNPSAAAVAFFALGVTAFGTALLLLFNPRSGPVRWFAAFQGAIMAWLAAQGWGYASGDWRWADPVVRGAVHLAPGIFLSFALAKSRRWRAGAAAAIATALLLLPAALAPERVPFSGPLLVAWNVGAWVSATWMLVREMPRETALGSKRRLGKVLVLGMVLVLPIGLLGGLLTGGATATYLMPLLMVYIQGIVFYGVARLRFYDIEVRAARTGELAAAAAEQERLAVVGELSAALAHEIRNPLTGVRSLAQRLAEEPVDEARHRRYAGVIIEEVARVERLVANLLGVARRPAPVPDAAARTPLAPLFEDVDLLVSGRAERAGVRVTCDAGGLSAGSPREPLAQAILNLLLNAMAHAPAGTAVDLRAAPDGRRVVVSVRDRGPGVPPELRDRIWEPFHTGGGGSGLGLAVVRGLARDWGWEADVADAPGGGAEFRLRIPAPAGPHPGGR